MKASRSERVDNISIEGKKHVETFHHHFFTLEPDEQVIKRGITRALYMADESAKQQYDNLRENRYYSNIIAGNISQRIEIDSIQLFLDKKPYYFRYYGTQQIIRTTSKVYRSLISEGYLREIKRSDNNDHGFLIERWNIIENRDLRTENR
jgi:conjugative transposon TraK protein